MINNTSGIRAKLSLTLIAFFLISISISSSSYIVKADEIATNTAVVVDSEGNILNVPEVDKEQDQEIADLDEENVHSEDRVDDDDDYYALDDDDDDDYEMPDQGNYNNNEATFDEDLCTDDNKLCAEWAEMGECEKNPNYMLNNCKRSCHVCKFDGSYGLIQNNHPNDENHEDISRIIDEMKTYMENDIYNNPELNFLGPRCKNRHQDCALWAAVGECDVNPSYMQMNCAPVCKSCHLLDFKYRCPIPPDAVDALKEGDLHRLFEKIVTTNASYVDGESDSAISAYDVNILSRPSPAPEDENKDMKNLDYKLGPWVITIDNFIKEDECDKLIELGGVEGYKRSEDVGKEQFDGTYASVQSESRTSWNAWCTDDCYKDPTAIEVAARIERLTGIPEPNSENLQLLRYEVGQFYKTHHDFIDKQEHFPAGVRTLTAFLYLNDVEEGGGTNFPLLDITVFPKKGRLLLWPSVLNHDPNKVDNRTKHQALPVEKGIKYAANAWLHMRDFKTPNDNNCT